MSSRRTDDQFAKSLAEKVEETIEQIATLQNMQQVLLRNLKLEAERHEKVENRK